MKQQWICEVCNQVFDNRLDCSVHEARCRGIFIIYICDKCGGMESHDTKEKPLRINERWHEIELGRMGYGSKLDGHDVNLMVCDNCLVDFVDSLANKDKIYNSGSSYYYYGDD